MKFDYKKILPIILVLVALLGLGFSQSNLAGYFILAGLILLAAVLVFWRFPEWGIYLMCLLFPFVYLELIYGDYDIPYVDAVALVLFVAWIIRALYLHLTKKQPLSLKSFPGAFFMAWYVLACLLSLLHVDRDFFYLSLKYLFRPIIFFYLMYVILPYNIIDNFDKYFKALKVMFWLGVGLALTGVWSLIFPPVVGFHRVMPIPIFGLYPLGNNHNQIAEVFIVIIPLALILFWRELNIFWKNIYLSGTLLMAGVTLLTLSRSGWIALALEMAILIYFKYRHKIKYIFTPINLYYLAILLVPAGVLMYMLVLSGITESATLNRLKLIDVALLLFKQYPLFGAGIGVFTQIMAQVKWYLLEYGEVLDEHSFIFKNLAETGIFGTVAFCLLVFYFIYRLFKAYQQTAKTQYSWIILGGLMSVAGIFAFQVFGTSYYLGKTWLIVGLAMASVKLLPFKQLARK